jgi:predicted alpha/beta-hydrolase family hydrolase
VFNLQYTGPESSKKCFILTHGAGEPSSSEFVAYFAEEIEKLNFRVIRFDFPYMIKIQSGTPTPKDDDETLKRTWRSVYQEVKKQKYETIIIGGKSMGGRAASLVAEELKPDALVCLGYPFHSHTNKNNNLYVDHLRDFSIPTLIIQGKEDPMGRPEDISGYKLSDKIEVKWITGEHGYQTPEGTNFSEATPHLRKFLRKISGKVWM